MEPGRLEAQLHLQSPQGGAAAQHRERFFALLGHHGFVSFFNFSTSARVQQRQTTKENDQDKRWRKKSERHGKESQEKLSFFPGEAAAEHREALPRTTFDGTGARSEPQKGNGDAK